MPNLLWTNVFVRKTGFRFIQVKLTTISIIVTLFEVLFIQDSGLFKVRFRQVLLYAKQIVQYTIIAAVQVDSHI
jgi:hypothetical protein